jgi:hypothetical protein
MYDTIYSMGFNKHTFWHNIRTISTGLFVIGLIPSPFLFMGSVNLSSVSAYGLYMLLSLVGIILGSILTAQYRHLADTEDTKKKREKIYGIIGLSLILIPLLVFLVISWLIK